MFFETTTKNFQDILNPLQASAHVKHRSHTFLTKNDAFGCSRVGSALFEWLSARPAQPFS